MAQDGPPALPVLRESLAGEKTSGSNSQLYSNQASQGAIRGLYRSGIERTTKLYMEDPNQVHESPNCL